MRASVLVTLALLLAGCTTPGGEPSALDTGTSGPAEGGSDGEAGSTHGSAAGGSGGVGASPTGAPNATGPPDWGSPDGRGIRPGINMEFEGNGCTTSFVFHQNWTRYFLATAAHCVEGGGPDGCAAPLFEGTEATLLKDTGGTTTATVAYSSWDPMQRTAESDVNTCWGNDFALLEVAARDVGDLHPASLHFGAPTALAEAPTDTVYAYGASIYRGGIEQTHPKQGRYIATDHGGWKHHVYLVSPGIPGDSGGHLMTSDGEALGIASTLNIAPTTGSNRYTDIAMALAYMEEHEGWAPELVTWDGWNPSLT